MRRYVDHLPNGETPWVLDLRIGLGQEARVLLAAIVSQRQAGKRVTGLDPVPVVDGLLQSIRCGRLAIGFC
jgi:hypothetical protein